MRALPTSAVKGDEVSMGEGIRDPAARSRT